MPKAYVKMTYDEIKQNLRKADKLVTEGKLAEADRLILSMLGKGMAQNDIQSNMHPDSVKKLREFTTSK